jgi:hypothetical protein
MVASLQLTESCKREMMMIMRMMIYYAPVLLQLTRASYAVRRKSEEELESCKLIFSQSGTTSGTACTCAF